MISESETISRRLNYLVAIYNASERLEIAPELKPDPDTDHLRHISCKALATTTFDFFRRFTHPSLDKIELRLSFCHNNFWLIIDAGGASFFIGDGFHHHYLMGGKSDIYGQQLATDFTQLCYLTERAVAGQLANKQETLQWLHLTANFDHPYYDSPYHCLRFGQKPHLTLLERTAYVEWDYIWTDLGAVSVLQPWPAQVLLSPAMLGLLSVINGRSKLAFCDHNTCTNIYIKKGQRLYCSDECRKWAKRLLNRRFTPSMEEALLKCLQQLAGEGGFHLAQEIYSWLADCRIGTARSLFADSLAGGHKIGAWLKTHRQELEQKHGLSYEAKTEAIQNRLKYRFQQN